MKTMCFHHRYFRKDGESAQPPAGILGDGDDDVQTWLDYGDQRQPLVLRGAGRCGICVEFLVLPLPLTRQPRGSRSGAILV